MTLAALLGPILFAWTPPARAHDGGPHESYRVLTYNVYGLHCEICGEDVQGRFGMTLEERAGHIADRVLAGSDQPGAPGAFDIVVFNEVFFDDVRDVLVERLRGSFPTIVAELVGEPREGDDVVEDFVREHGRQDSGLMLFSRFPLGFLDVPEGEACHRAVAGGCVVAFHRFDACSGDVECVATKGIGLVRLSNPVTGRPLNVFFTHLQSGGEATERVARIDQVGEAVGFVSAWAPMGVVDDETLLLGDLNIRELSASEGVDEDYAALIRDGGFASIGFQDSWRASTSAADLGFSNIDDEGESTRRIDHILYRSGSQVTPACFQHHRLERGFFAEHTPLSDHLPVSSLIAPGSPGTRCNPARALHVAMELGDEPIFVSEGFAHPNEYKWLLVNNPGTYSFRIVGRASEASFYAVDDLSTPLAPFEGDGVFDDLVSLPEPVVLSPREPFFVRVRAIEPAGGTVFTMRIDRHSGDTFDSAIQLDPFDPMEAIQMDLGALSLGAVHYRIRQHALLSGAAQALVFETRDHPGLELRLSVWDDETADVDGVSTLFEARAAGLEARGETPAFSEPEASLAMGPGEAGELPPDEDDFFLVVERRLACDGPCPMGTFEVEWRTDAVFVEVVRVTVLDQHDFPDLSWPDTADDEVVPFLQLDGLLLLQPVGDMDNGATRSLSGQPFDGRMPPFAFASPLSRAGVYEEDADLDVIGSTPIPRPAGSTNRTEGLAEFEFSGEEDTGDWKYRLTLSAWTLKDD